MQGWFWVATLTLILGGSCASTTNLRTARTVAPNSFQVLVAPSAMGGINSAGVTTVYPQIDLALRRGITSQFDLGIRLSVVQLSVEAAYQLQRAPSKSNGLDILLAPVLGYVTWGLAGAGVTQGFNGVDLHMPVLFGFNFANETSVILSPRLSQRIMFLRGAGTTYMMMPGFSFGVAMPKIWSLIVKPEVGVSLPIQLASSISPGVALAAGGIEFHAALGFLIGGH